MNKRSLYAISKINSDEAVCGIFTNKKYVHDAIKTLSKNCTVAFSGIINYENKTVNYTNVLNLLNTLFDNESFLLNVANDSTMVTYEIKKIKENMMQITKA